MKKENTVTVLLALLFSYWAYRWAGTLYKIIEHKYSFSIWNGFYIGLLLVAIAGLLQYYLSQFKRSQLLRAYLLFSLVVSFFSLMSTIEMAVTPENRVQAIQGIVREIVEVVIVCYSLNVLVANRKPEVINGNYFPASKGKRFLNRLLDITPFVIMVLSYIEMWNYSFMGYFDGALLYPLELVFLFLYYSLLEYFFHTTFGKTVTNTTVVNVNGKYASLSTILLRSICRFIPFDALSFFGTKGWHDSISNTMVVSETYSEESK